MPFERGQKDIQSLQRNDASHDEKGQDEDSKSSLKPMQVIKIDGLKLCHIKCDCFHREVMDQNLVQIRMSLGTQRMSLGTCPISLWSRLMAEVPYVRCYRMAHTRRCLVSHNTTACNHVIISLYIGLWALNTFLRSMKMVQLWLLSNNPDWSWTMLH